MRFESRFSVPGTPEEVIAKFADVEKMAGYMPGASIEGRDEDGSYPGTLTVSFGPKRFTFRGRVRCETDAAARTGRIEGRGAADARSARIKADITYALHAEDGPTPSTRVELVSEADLQGVIADFARTGGVPVANAILQEFGARFAADAHPTPGVPPLTNEAGRESSLSGLRLMWLVLRAFWDRAMRRLKGHPT